jgi:uncharacterized membrane protein YhaH (DUF805 family)
VEDQKEEKMRNPDDIPIDALICFLLATITVAVVIRPLANCGLSEWWWGFFMICNIGYLIVGYKKGWAKPDIGNGMIVAVGPITFYSWTYINAWRKYGPKKGVKDE